MTDYKKLCDELREEAQYEDDCRERAAEAIERLSGELEALKKAQGEPVGKIDYDKELDRYYIPVHPDWEIQTKGKGSSFRIANTKTGIRHLVMDKMLHEMLEQMARDINAAHPPEDAKDAAKKVADDIAYNWLPNIKRREQESSREKAMHNAIVDDCIKHVLNYVPEAK